MGGEPAHTQTPKHNQPAVMAHTLNDEPYGIQAFMYEPESEPERESEEAETVKRHVYSRTFLNGKFFFSFLLFTLVFYM